MAGDAGINAEGNVEVEGKDSGLIILAVVGDTVVETAFG